MNCRREGVLPLSFLPQPASALSFFRVGNFKTAVGFHVQVPEFFDSVDVKLVIDSGGFVAAADVVVVPQGFPDNLFALLAGCVFY